MRINLYAEEITPRVEVIERTDVNGIRFVGVRFYTKPTTFPDSAVTFWAFDFVKDKADLRNLFAEAADKLHDTSL